MRIYTDYLASSSSIYTEDYIDLNDIYGSEISDTNKIKLFKESLPKHATVKMINSKLQVVPSGEIPSEDLKDPNSKTLVYFKPKIKLNEIILKLDLYEIKIKNDQNLLKLYYSFKDETNSSLLNGEIVGKDDMIIFKDLRSVLYSNNITEWSHVFRIVLNLHGDLTKNTYLYGEAYNDIESKMTIYLTSMLTVISFKTYEDKSGITIDSNNETEYSFPESLDKLDDQTKEQILMIINKVRQAKSLSMRIKLDGYGSSFVIGEGKPRYDLEITKGNIKFTDKDHVTNIEIDQDDILAVSIDEFLTSNFDDLGTITTTATIGEGITFINNENPSMTVPTSGYSSPVEMCKYDETYSEYIKAVGQLGAEDEKLVTNMTDLLISHETDGINQVYMADKDMIVVKDPDTGDFIMTISRECPFKLKLDTRNSSKCTSALTVKSCTQIWDYLIEILKQH